MSRKYVGKVAAKLGPRPKTRRGRPCLISETERRALLLSAAERVFVDVGYTEANMDDIAKRAHMSKKTLYRLFDTKEALFAAVVAARRAELAETLAIDRISDSRSPELVLRDFLLGIVRFILAPRQAALYRLVIAESHRAPELARAFHQDCPGKLCDFLKGWIKRQNERGVLAVENPEIASGMLFSMVIGEPQMRALMCDGRDADPRAVEQRIEYAVNLFLKGAKPRRSTANRSRSRGRALH